LIDRSEEVETVLLGADPDFGLYFVELITRSLFFVLILFYVVLSGNYGSVLLNVCPGALNYMDL
jgi:hypothetical protein